MRASDFDQAISLYQTVDELRVGATQCQECKQWRGGPKQWWCACDEAFDCCMGCLADNLKDAAALCKAFDSGWDGGYERAAWEAGYVTTKERRHAWCPGCGRPAP